MKRPPFIMPILLVFVFNNLISQTNNNQRSDVPADLVLRNGKIITVEDQWPHVSALAIKGDRIVAIGSNRDIQKFVGKETEVIDLNGMLAIPGLIEGHGHFMGMGGDFTQAIRPVPQGIKPRHNGQQNLRGADVRCGFFAPDMLFARLQSQPISWLAVLVL